MPDRERPREPRFDSQRVRRPDSRSLQRSSPHPTPLAATHGKPVVVVGVPSDIPRALEHPAIVAGTFSVVAVIAVDITDEAAGPSHEDVSRLEILMRSEAATTVLMAGPVGSHVMRSVADLAAIHRCDLLAVMPTEVLTEHEPVVVRSGDASFIELMGANRHPWAPAIKRCLDVVIAAIGLVVTAPVIALASLAVWLESPGSPLFRHERVGYRGQRFLCLKLRTMMVDAEDRLRADSSMYEEYRRHHFKIPDDRDPRVTRLGKWLRRTSIDELPQLWNVLVGEMSLVGPRPVVTEELELYGREKTVVLSVRPGITGAWAVNGRQQVGYPERCAIELRYVRGWRLGNDVRILAKTLVVVGRSTFASPM
jgi:exopolysaccharide production protein ExoY